MDLIIYYIAGTVLLLSIVVFIGGLIRPEKFNPYVNGTGTRGSVAWRAVGLFLVAAVLVAAFEPEVSKQARLDKEKAAIASEQALDTSSRAQADNLSPEQQEAAVDEAARAAAAQKAAEPVPVASITDGDTFKVQLDGTVQAVRLVGLDTPEVSQCFGAEATAALATMLSGKKVRLERDLQQGDKDKYNRLLRFVFLEDGTSINQQLIAGGFAYEALYSRNPHLYHTQYVNAQAEAKAASRGLWATETCAGQRTKPQPAAQPQAGSPAQATAPRPEALPAPAPGSVYYANCTAVRAAGAAPIYPGQPGFRSDFDGDNDGIGCE